MTDDSALRILVVCTGNVYRSPLFGGLLRIGLSAVAPGQFLIETAGTHAQQGLPMDHQIASILSEHGATPRDFRTKELTGHLLSAQHLVVAATRAQRSHVLGLRPALLLRTFTMLELARILPLLRGRRDVPARERWNAALPEVARHRSSSALAPFHDDIADPAGRDDRVFARMVAQVLPAVDALVGWEAAHRRGDGAADMGS